MVKIHAAKRTRHAGKAVAVVTGRTNPNDH